MTLRERITISIIFSILLILLAVLVWAYQTGKDSIFGSEQSHQIVYDYQTVDKWKSGQFENASFLTNPNFLLAKFNYYSSSQPPFPDITYRCDTNDTKCIGANKIIEVNYSGGLLPFYNKVTVYSDGKVTKEVQTEKFTNPPTTTTTCFSGEEMAELLSMIDGSGFWTAKDYPQTGMDPTDGPGYNVIVNLKGQEKKLSVYAASQSAPVKLKNTFRTLLTWPDSRQSRDTNTCYPQTGWGTYNSTASYTSSAIGSDKVNSFLQLKIETQNLYLPSTASNKFPGYWQFAGSKDNYSSWSQPVKPSVVCVTTPCNLETVDIDLSKISQLQNRSEERRVGKECRSRWS